MILENSIIFVTGGVSGFGRHLVEHLLLQGARVIIADISDKGEEMAKEIDQNYFLFVKCDVTQKFQVKEAMYHAYSLFGQIDAVINCVGLFSVDPTVVRTSLSKFYTAPRGYFANFLGSLYSTYYFTQLKSEGPGSCEGVILNRS
ncbi:unnamed protein product [Moneuplotes crassus]|uniref:Uncharacterized protein n=1 Tax=Euplotes crassus TaxID=5936 RepID=A0AAD1XI25_EUPCR|nr:unnamed protein product [Moneuplotes crassus]